jgi:hypothetical protein
MIQNFKNSLTPKNKSRVEPLGDSKEWKTRTEEAEYINGNSNAKNS